MDKKIQYALIIIAVLLIGAIANFQGFLPNTLPIGSSDNKTNTADTIIKVTDVFTGNPLAEARVSVDGGSITLTSSDGTAEFPSLEHGEHKITVEYKGQINNTKIMVSETRKSFIITVPAPKEINVRLLDLETDKPIGNQDVYIDNKKIGSTTQDGNIKIKDMMPGDYILSLEKVATTPSTKLTVSKDENHYTGHIDMPNPIFTVAGKLESSLLPGDTNKATVEIVNTGQIPSEDTIAVVLEYQDDNGKPKLIDKDVISFGEIPPTGIPTEKESRWLSNPWLVWEDIVIVVFDKNEYVPEQDWSVRLGVPKDAISSWTSNAINHCNTNAKDCAEVAGVFAGTALKTLLG